MPVFNAINTLGGTTDLTAGKDANKPYSFQDWKARNINISSVDAFAQYDAYLKNWYLKRDVANVVSSNYVKEYYKSFLKTLGITARNAYEKQLFENVDIDNDSSLQATITGYARRLKDIAVYIANKRNSVVYSKLKNNLTGTSTSLERLFYSYILTAFTRKQTPDGLITTSFTITDPNILNSLPFVSDVSDFFSVKIEETYDTNNYFDRDPSLPVTTYTSIASGTPEALYSTGSYSPEIDYNLDEDSIIVNIITSMALATTDYFVYTGDGTSTTFSTPGITSSNASEYQVSISGIIQTPNSSYSVSTINQNIVFYTTPPASSIIVIIPRY